MKLSKEQIERKIQILKEDLALQMQMEGSVMSDNIATEIEFLKKELQKRMNLKIKI